MVYSAWRILFSVINDMVNGNTKTTYEKQWNLLRDMFVLCKPHVLQEEGFPVILSKSFTSYSQQGIYIFSLNDLEIQRPYLTKNNTLIVRISSQEVQMGELNSNTKDPNGIVTLHIPSDNELKSSFYCPTISGILISEIMILALEQFTKRKLQKGMFFYEFVSGDLQFGRCIKNLEELSPNITYVSEDYSVKLKRKSGGRYSFFFTGYNIQETSIMSPIKTNNDIPILEPFPINIINNNDEITEQLNEIKDNKEIIEEKKNEVIEDNIDDEINDILNDIDTNIDIPIPPPINIPLPPPLLKSKKTLDTPNKRKMRPLRWSTIPRHQLQETIWGQEKSPVNSLVSVKEKDLERLFSISPINTPTKQSSRKNISKKKSLLPLKRANNISIVLSRLCDINELYKQILLESKTKLTIDELNSFNSILPITDDDIQPIEEYLKENLSNNLSKAEEFIIKFKHINRLQEKVHCLQFMYLLKEYYNDIIPKINTVSLACKEAYSSKSLKKLLKLILQIGSILNRDTYLSGRGFRLQSLTTISQTKAKCGNVTLLHYLSNLLSKDDPNLLYFESTEIPHCYEASKIPINAIIIQVKDLIQNIKQIEHEISCIQNDKENSQIIYENFTLTLNKFYKEAIIKVEQMEKKTNQLQELFAKVGAYFGEDPNDISTCDFFYVIHDFSEKLLKTQLDNRATRLMKKIVETPSPKHSNGNISCSPSIINDISSPIQ